MLVRDRYQVECGPSNQHMVDLVENSYYCRNWDLTSIPCMHAVVVIHKKDEYPETYVKRHKVGLHNQVVAPIQQEATPTQQQATPTQQKATPTHQQTTSTYQQVAAPREKLLLKRKPTTVRWISSTQELFVPNLSMTL
ncbi:hypothetical protein GOBAR_AA27599 [Gossypium barbadense]|uniref:SWIM-type domain-containing protein n=1 Tax=Gossypium barbadense TaxID=3634 RepID=A0A2P5WPQ7_GOSBA|nr:hypothetical protein GOBAR_AA27599 [Gossypium barbadense]